jgi:uncharacterized Zn finger protein
MFLYKCRNCGKTEAAQKLVERRSEATGRMRWEHQFECQACDAVFHISPGLKMPTSRKIKVAK